MTNMERGRRLAEARTRIGRSQRWVANQALVSDRTVWRAEQGQPIADESLVALCLVLDLDPATLRSPGDEGDTSVGHEDPIDPVDVGTGQDRPPANRQKITRKTFFLGVGAAFVFLMAMLDGFPFEGIPEKVIRTFASPIRSRYDQEERAVGMSVFFSEQLADAARTVAEGDPAAIDASVARIANKLRTVTQRYTLCSSCPESYEANDVVRTREGLQVRIGLVRYDDFGSSIARGLPRTSKLRILAATSATPVDPLPGAMWADPRGVIDGEFPGGRNGPYLFFRIEGNDVR